MLVLEVFVGSRVTPPPPPPPLDPLVNSLVHIALLAAYYISAVQNQFHANLYILKAKAQKAAVALGLRSASSFLSSKYISMAPRSTFLGLPFPSATTTDMVASPSPSVLASSPIGKFVIRSATRILDMLPAQFVEASGLKIMTPDEPVRYYQVHGSIHLSTLLAILAGIPVIVLLLWLIVREFRRPRTKQATSPTPYPYHIGGNFRELSVDTNSIAQNPDVQALGDKVVEWYQTDGRTVIRIPMSLLQGWFADLERGTAPVPVTVSSPHPPKPNLALEPDMAMVVDIIDEMKRERDEEDDLLVADIEGGVVKLEDEGEDGVTAKMDSSTQTIDTPTTHKLDNSILVPVADIEDTWDISGKTEQASSDTIDQQGDEDVLAITADSVFSTTTDEITPDLDAASSQATILDSPHAEAEALLTTSGSLPEEDFSLELPATIETNVEDELADIAHVALPEASLVDLEAREALSTPEETTEPGSEGPSIISSVTEPAPTVKVEEEISTDIPDSDSEPELEIDLSVPAEFLQLPTTTLDTTNSIQPSEIEVSEISNLLAEAEEPAPAKDGSVIDLNMEVETSNLNIGTPAEEVLDAATHDANQDDEADETEFRRLMAESFAVRNRENEDVVDEAEQELEEPQDNIAVLVDLNSQLPETVSVTVIPPTTPPIPYPLPVFAVADSSASDALELALSRYQRSVAHSRSVSLPRSRSHSRSNSSSGSYAASNCTQSEPSSPILRPCDDEESMDEVEEWKYQEYASEEEFELDGPEEGSEADMVEVEIPILQLQGPVIDTGVNADDYRQEEYSPSTSASSSSLASPYSGFEGHDLPPLPLTSPPPSNSKNLADIHSDGIGRGVSPDLPHHHDTIRPRVKEHDLTVGSPPLSPLHPWDRQHSTEDAALGSSFWAGKNAQSDGRWPAELATVRPDPVQVFSLHNISSVPNTTSLNSSPVTQQETHTADRPNWALAPREDEPSSSAVPASNSSLLERMDRGRRGGRARPRGNRPAAFEQRHSSSRVNPQEPSAPVATEGSRENGRESQPLGLPSRPTAPFPRRADAQLQPARMSPPERPEQARSLPEQPEQQSNAAPSKIHKQIAYRMRQNSKWTRGQGRMPA